MVLVNNNYINVGIQTCCSQNVKIFMTKITIFPKSNIRFYLKYYKHLILYLTEGIDVGTSTNGYVFIQIPTSHIEVQQHKTVLVFSKKCVLKYLCRSLENFIIINFNGFITSYEHCFRVGICFPILYKEQVLVPFKLISFIIT